MNILWDEGRPFADLRSTGLLWLINASLLHPRGYAMQLHLDDHGNATGWSIIGDGAEPWEYDMDGAEKDRLFRAVQLLLG